MYKLDFTLKQHTPIIHFQHDQEGATLRASEVKPKLDRFLITLFGKGNYEAGKTIAKNKGWLIGNNDHFALDYKLKIIQDEVHTIDLKNPNYFGNIGLKPGDPKKEHRFGNTDLRGTFLFMGFFQPDNFFQENLITFFLLNNFGCRNGKGFGSFTLSSFNQTLISVTDNISHFKSIANDGLFRLRYKDYLSFNSIEPSDIFQIIDYYSKRLKTGINYTRHDRKNKLCTGEYKKSFLFNYIKTNTWEKRWLKEKFINLSPEVASEKLEPKFTRALFGLTDKYSFMDKSKLKSCTCYQGSTKVAHPFKFEIKVHSDEIDRIPSPIIYKPLIIGDSTLIFLLIENEYSAWDILDKAFKFKMQDLQFPLYIGKTNTRGEPKPDFIKQKEFDDFNRLIKIHTSYLKENIRIKDQSNELKEFFAYQVPGEEILRTPSRRIEIKSLIEQYHFSLGKSFNAFDFQNKRIANVKIESI
ncbi:MAG: hypothetical protein V1775_00145 [Bacteroidota bacterium]